MNIKNKITANIWLEKITFTTFSSIQETQFAKNANNLSTNTEKPLFPITISPP